MSQFDLQTLERVTAQATRIARFISNSVIMAAAASTFILTAAHIGFYLERIFSNV